MSFMLQTWAKWIIANSTEWISSYITDPKNDHKGTSHITLMGQFVNYGEKAAKSCLFSGCLDSEK